MKRKHELRFQLGGAEVTVSFWFAALAALYTVSSPEAVAAALAVTVHECSHLLALRLCRGQIKKLRFSLAEIDFVTDLEELPPGKRLFVAAAGPLSNFLLGAVSYYYSPAFACTNFLIGSFQALPVFSMDGGTAFEILCRGKGERARKYLSFFLSFLILSAGIYLLVISRYNLSLLIAGGYLLFLSLQGSF